VIFPIDEEAAPNQDFRWLKELDRTKRVCFMSHFIEIQALTLFHSLFWNRRVATRKLVYCHFARQSELCTDVIDCQLRLSQGLEEI